MPRFMIGGVEFFLFRHDQRAPFRTHHDLVLGALEFAHRHRTLVAARGEQGRLVHEVRQIRAGKAGRAARNYVGLHIVAERHLAHMHFQDLFAAAHVGQRHDHLPVKPAGPQQRGIEHVGAIGRGNDDDAFVALEAIHFYEQLVQRLLALVVTTAKARAAMATDRVDFVDKDDAGCVLLSLFEHVAHPRGAHADEHFDEIGTGDREKRHLGFAGDRARQQRLAGAGRTHHQDAFRDLAAKFLEFARIFKEVDDFDHFLLGFLHSRNVRKGDAHLVFAEQAGA